MDDQFEPPASSGPRLGLTRRQLIGRLAAAGFSTPVITSIVAGDAWAQEASPAATPAASPPAGPAATPAASTVASPAATPAATPVAGGPTPHPSLSGLDPRLIVNDPLNLETPLELVEGLNVPNDLFFVRNHAPVPDIDPSAWRLAVSGMVHQQVELSLDDLKNIRSTMTITSFLECSGNSRGRYQPAGEGTQWGNGGVGNAEWTGVPLRDVLLLVGVQEQTVAIVSQGGDIDEMRRGLPLDVAMEPNTLIVWQMNGADLPPAHGGPVRLLVPGWGGIASIKWLVGLEAIDHVFDGRFNTESYVIIDPHGKKVRAVQEMPVKSVIVAPIPGEQLNAGQQTITGFAWSGNAGIATVEVSVDNGVNWAEAQITEEAGPLSWVRFEYAWDAQPGRGRLQSRATDGAGLQQPAIVQWNAKGYQNNGIYEVQVTVA